MKFDLHTHTKYSDGELSIEGNIKRAKELNLDGIAITDHDNVDSWEYIDTLNEDFNIIKGVELSTFYEGDSVHVLGYYKNEGDYTELRDFLKEMRKKRKVRVQKMIQLLKDIFDIEISYEDVAAKADGSIGRPHVAQTIMEKYPERNYTSNYIFEHFIGDGKPAYVQTYNLETKDAIELLKRNNCLVVLAHPLLIKKHNYKEVLTLDFDGVEVYYPYLYHEVLKYVKDKDYIVTGGSDYHGPTRRNTMGISSLSGEYLETFVKSINYHIKKEPKVLTKK